VLDFSAIYDRKIERNYIMTIIQEPVDLNIPYKGSRDYLRGADIFNQTMSYCSEFEEFVMFFFRKMNSRILLVPTEKRIDKSVFAGSIYYKISGVEHCLGILDDHKKPMTTRVPYDEQRAIKGFQMDTANKLISLNTIDTHDTFIDKCVALNKILLENVISHEIKWAFTKLELNKKPIEPITGTIKLQFKSQIGLSLVKSAIYIDEEIYGYIYFSDFTKAYQ
jgi:hypothetical protein